MLVNTAGATIEIVRTAAAGRSQPVTEGASVVFELPRESPVNLRIFDITGWTVRTLVAGRTLAAGRYSMPWNGQDESGSRLASGVYFCRMTAGEFAATRRVVLIDR